MKKCDKMIIGDNMETLESYFLYETDYSSINKIFSDLSRKLKDFHSRNIVVNNLDASNVVYKDGSFEFKNVSENNNESAKRKNIVTLGKMMLGTYLSLSTGFKDFSLVQDSWFSQNIDEITSSIMSEDFDQLYFRQLFSGSNEYYSDYLDRKKQSDELNSKNNVAQYKKVLKNAASSLSDEQDFVIDEEVDVERKTASLSTFFYPLLIGGALILSVTLSWILKTIIK